MNANTSYHTPDAFSIPSIVIGLPNGTDLEVSWITFRCISTFNHANGETAQVRGGMGLATFLDELITPDDDPTPPAAPIALRLVEQSSVYAVRNSKRETKVNIPTQVEGTIVDCHNSADEMTYWLNYHAKKYGAVTRISVNPYSFAGMGTVDGVEIYRTDSVLPGHVWMGTDSAKASAA